MTKSRMIATKSDTSGLSNYVSDTRRKRSTGDVGAFSWDVRACENILSSCWDDQYLGALVTQIHNLLQTIKTAIFPSSSSSSSAHPPKMHHRRWILPNSSDLFKLQNMFSELADAAAGVEDGFSSSSSKDQAKLVVHVAHAALEGIGRCHWVAAGLLVVCCVIDRWQLVSSNKRECLELLDEMYRLAKYIRDAKHKKSPKPDMAHLMETGIEMVVQGAIMCFSQAKSSLWYRFVGAYVNKQKLGDLRAGLERMRNHLVTEMIVCIYNTHNEIRFPRQMLFPEHAVGIEDQIKKIAEMLEFESDKKVVAVILYGFGGIGKTTLLDAVYSSIHNLDAFEFSKVRLFEDINSRPVITKVQYKILQDIAGDVYPEPAYETDGHAYLRHCFKIHRCFVCIDNVQRGEELTRLLPKSLDNCKKLRLLLAGRNAEMRDALGIADPENIKLFDVVSLATLPDSLATLVLKKEMGERTVRQIDEEDINFLLRICGGVPLCLEMVGRFMRSETDKIQALDALKEEHKCGFGDRFAMKKIDFFTFAFDDLEESHKEAFLDICAFFNGKPWIDLQKIFGGDTMRVLENRSLIKGRLLQYSAGVHVDSEAFVCVQVHDVLLEIGRKRGRTYRITSLSQLKRIFQKQDKDFMSRVKGLYLQDSCEEAAEETVELLASKLDFMSSSLRIFRDHSMNPKRNTICHILSVTSRCKATFSSLLYCDFMTSEPPFDISRCKSLRWLSYAPTIPVHLQKLPKSLRDLSLLYHDPQREMRIVCPAVGKVSVLGNLWSFLIKHPFQKIPKGLISSMKSLRELRIHEVPSLTELPDEFDSLSRLNGMWVVGTALLKRLPNSLGRSVSLKTLVFQQCEGLEELPQNFSQLSALETLELRECKSLKQLPHDFGMLSSLQVLNLWGSENLTALAETFSLLPALKLLDLHGCKNLQGKWLDTLLQLKSLRVLYIGDCPPLIKEWKQIGVHYPSVKCVY